MPQPLLFTQPSSTEREGGQEQVPMLVGLAWVESPSQGARGGFTRWKARISKMQHVLNGRGEKLGKESSQEWSGNLRTG